MIRSLGVDLGGSKLLACVTGPDGRVLARAVRPTGRHTDPDRACALVADAVNELRRGGAVFDTMGMGFPGLVDFSRGFVHGSVMLDGWQDVALADRLAEAFQVPCVVDNDVNAAAVAELHRRARAIPSSMLFVAVGTGIGGALAFGDQLWRGHTGVAGEIGNVTIDRYGSQCWCGRRGCLNTSASGTAIARHQAATSERTAVARSSNTTLSSAVQDAAVALGIGLANALNLLNPELVVLGGGVATLGRRWLDVVATAARAEAFPQAGRCRIELARAGYEAGALGAALLAARQPDLRQVPDASPNGALRLRSALR